MKIVALVLILMALDTRHSLAQEDPISAFQLKWDNSKEYLIEIAELMPEGNYDFKPTEGQMTFQEQLLHIRKNMLWLSHDFLAERIITGTDLFDLNKAETIRLLISACDTVRQIVSELDEKELKDKVGFRSGSATKLQILNLIQDHVTHHRGQLIVYLRLQGIEPPRYVGW